MKHISYSELKIWSECPFKHKLVYIDKVKAFQGNEFTAFGRALHELCENTIYGKVEDEEDYIESDEERNQNLSYEDQKKEKEMQKDENDKRKKTGVKILINPTLEHYINEL